MEPNILILHTAGQVPSPAVLKCNFQTALLCEMVVFFKLFKRLCKGNSVLLYYQWGTVILFANLAMQNHVILVFINKFKNN